MPPVRRSRRLARQDVEEDGRPYDCFICLTQINVNMHHATATPCCQRRIHRQCYQSHVHTSDTCSLCREPFTVHEAQAMAAIANPEPEHPIVTDRGYFQNSVLSLCQALLIRRRRMEYYVIKVSFCREFQTSFFEAHHLSPRTFFINFFLMLS